MKLIGLLILLTLGAQAQTENFELKLKDVEKQAIGHSNRLKALNLDVEAAESQAESRYASLFPKLSLQGNYQYNFTLPNGNIGVGPPLVFGNDVNYMLGPTLSYTLWDTFAVRDAYHAASDLASARTEEKKSGELQLLYALRASYIQVQLGLEELRLINETLQLSKAQDHDVQLRFRAGAAAQLDVVTSGRSVLSYEIQLRQKQAELSAALRDLLALMGDKAVTDFSHPGPEGVSGVTLVLKFDPLEKSLAEEAASEIPAPGESQPQLKQLAFLSSASAEEAKSETARLFPVVQVAGNISRTLPNLPNPSAYWQESVGVSLSMPLYLGDPTWAAAAQKRSESEAALSRRQQLKEDLERDFTKGNVLLESLQDQRKLAAEDVTQSEKAAKLYYSAYRAGKVNLIDVQNANVQALQSKVGSARIMAQILNQTTVLKSISGKELLHE